MSMTTEQIQYFRDLADDPELDMLCTLQDGECRKALRKAAETIEFLSAKLHASQMERSSQYYHGGWIPCDEKLPEINEEVLLTICDNSSIYGYSKRFSHVRYGKYQPKSDKRDWLVDNVRYFFGNVIAWRPLPEPYLPNEEAE